MMLVVRLNSSLHILALVHGEADQLIKAGLIQVNGKIIVEMGFRVMPTDTVTPITKQQSELNVIYF